MPRRRVKWSGAKAGRGVPPGVKAAALADVMAGGRSISETARNFGLDPLTVKKLADTVSGINGEDVLRIERGLPRLFAVLAAEHATEALKRVRSDPASAVRSTFGAKLAAEAGRLSTPAGEHPGRAVLAFVQSLAVVAPPAPAEPAPVIETTAEAVVLPRRWSP